MSIAQSSIPIAGFLHIPKTGGTAIRTALDTARQQHSVQPIKYFDHNENLLTVAPLPVFFVIRDPVARVISSFYSRKRCGRPRYHSPHSPEEKEVFGKYSELGDLLDDIAAGVPGSDSAYRAVGHLRPLSHWLVGVEALKSTPIWFIGELSCLTVEWEKLRKKAGLPAKVTLPRDLVGSHRRPFDPPPMSSRALDTLRNLLASDYEIYRFCVQFRSQKGWKSN